MEISPEPLPPLPPQIHYFHKPNKEQKGSHLNTLQVHLVEGEQARKGFATLLELGQGGLCPLLPQGPLPALVQSQYTAAVTAPLLQQVLEEGLVPHMQAAATQPCMLISSLQQESFCSCY